MNHTENHNLLHHSNVKVYLFLGLATSVYATLLNTESGKRIADEETWLTVSFGTALVLGFCRLLLPSDAWNKVLLAFVIGGSPLIFRSLQNKI
ncbi:MAG: hypothetical protein R2911_27180 [Caldilineaceae bacterium]